MDKADVFALPSRLLGQRRVFGLRFAVYHVISLEFMFRRFIIIHRGLGIGFKVTE